MKISIYDVAKKSGVSISTASKALNDRKDVGEATKDRIRKIAKELNYEPSRFARALAMRKTGNIGILTVRYYNAPMLTNPFYSKIIEGIEEHLINSDMNLITNILRKEQVVSGEIPKMVKEKSADGIVLLGHMPADFVRMIVDRDMPAVMVDNYVKDAPVSSIIIDNVDGAYKAVSYLLDSGHKNVAYVSGSQARYSFKQREIGYRKALAERSIMADDRLIVFNDNDEPGYEWMKKIMDGPKKPDAIFACNDVHAILAINMLKDMGINVPDDVSVMGFDNIELTEHFIPSISTIDVNKEAMGIKASDMLVDIINTKKNRVENILFPASLVIRNSVKQRI
jgi:DNA-binding LacI/PurR family transcriptional regulator